MTEASGNLLLDLLPSEEREKQLAEMEHIPIAIRQVLGEAGRPMSTVYFPTDGIVSIIAIVNGDRAVEAASVGREGMAGVEVFLGGLGPDNVRLVCQVDGAAWTMDSALFRERTRNDGAFRGVLERYARAMFVQTMQSAACNGSHTVEERLSKWLRLIADWLKREEFPLTHDFAAALLGVHRPSVTLAAGALQRAGIIEYERGRIRILDLDALTDVSCECYGVIRRAYDSLRRANPREGPGAVMRLAALRDSVQANRAAAAAASKRASELIAAAVALGSDSVRVRPSDR